MKKLSLYVFLSLLWCNVGFAGPTTVEAAKDHFFKNRESLDPIEGIWYDAESTMSMKGTYAIYKVGEGLYSRWIVENSVSRLSGTQDGPSSGSIRVSVSDKIFSVKSTWMRDRNDPSKDYISHGTIIMTGINMFEETHDSSKQIYIRMWGDKLVKKTAPTKPENEFTPSSGTAFFVTQKGHVITNFHVVEGCKDKSKIVYQDNEVKVKLIAKDKYLDLALLKADIENKHYIVISNKSPKKLQRIIAAGYPFGKELSDDLKFTSGIISSLKGLQDDSTRLQIDAALNYGNSGGPIVDEKTGELVAVAVAGLSKEVTESINFGIKAGSLKNFLDSNQINTSLLAKNFSFGNVDLSSILENATVYTFCN